MHCSNSVQGGPAPATLPPSTPLASLNLSSASVTSASMAAAKKQKEMAVSSLVWVLDRYSMRRMTCTMINDMTTASSAQLPGH